MQHRRTYSIPWHRHTTTEIHYVLNGELAYEFSSNDAVITVPGGHLLVIPVGLRHRAVENIGAPAARLSIQLNKPSPAACQFSVFKPKEMVALFSAFTQNTARCACITAQINQAARKLYSTIGNPNGRFDHVRLRILINILIAETAAAFAAPPPNRDSTIATQLTDYIRHHFAEKLQIEDLVRKSGFERSRLYELFMRDVGISPNDYLIRCRIDHARQMLTETTLSLDRIAAECGFVSSAYFSTVFRKYVGIPPRVYRSGNKR